MAVYADREAFIPYRKADVVELCMEDGKLSKADAQQFKEFCEIVGAYYHFDFHKDLEDLKNNFAPFDPDSDTKVRFQPNAEQKKEMSQKLVDELSKILEKANYSKLTEQELEEALTKESLITLKMKVDWNDYSQWLVYHRGNGEQTVELKKMMGLKKVPFTMDTYDRVMLFLQFKEEDYFLAKFKGKKKKLEALNFTPGKTYLYMYKNIPKADLEVLFPNVEISMNMKDKAMLTVPAIGAGLAMLPKLLPTLAILIGLIIAFVSGKEAIQQADVMKGVVSALSLLVVLGGFAFKQYVKFKNKKIQFLKQVTDTLFFKNLVCNAGVFSALIDSAEDEECKEVFLAYYHLLTSEKPLTQEELDDKIENWLETKFQTKIDFNVEKALDKLQNLKGKVTKEGEKEEDVQEVPVLTKDADGKLHVLPIGDSKTVIDYVWDNIFQYNVVLE